MLTSAAEVIIANAIFSRLPSVACDAQYRAARSTGEADRAGRTGYSDCEVRPTCYHYLVKGLQIYEYRRRPLLIMAKSPSQTTTGHRWVKQPGSAQPVAESGSQSDHPIGCLTRRCAIISTGLSPGCQRIDKTMLPKRNWWRLGVSVMAFHFHRATFRRGRLVTGPYPRGWPESARRSSRKIELRTASSLQPG